MKKEPQGTFLAGAGELNLGLIPVTDARVGPVTKDVRRAYLYIPRKLLGIHQKNEVREALAPLEKHLSPSKRKGFDGMDLRLPLPDPSEKVDAVHFLLGRKAVEAARTFEGRRKVHAVPIPVGYAKAPYPSGYQCSLILRREQGWQSLFATMGFFEGGDPDFSPQSVRHGQVLTYLNGRDLAVGALVELEHGDTLGFRNRDEKADIGMGNRLLYLEESNFALAAGGSTVALLFDREPLARVGGVGRPGERILWMRRRSALRIGGKETGYGGVTLDGKAIEAEGGAVLVGSVPDRLLQAMASGEHGPCEALVLPERERGVSGLHARVRFEGGKLLLEDLDSSAGTWRHDGERFVRLEGATPVSNGDVLAFGGIQSKVLFP